MDQLEDKLIVIIQVLFIFLFVILNLINKIFPSIELLFSFFILVFIWRSKDRKLLISLLPFIILLLIFQSLRGFADNLSPSQVHITDILGYERKLFWGNIPAHYIQVFVQTLPIRKLVSLFCNLIYISHFINPLIVALLLWYKKPEGYWYFVGGLLIITYLAFIIYYLYPAAPPWYATQNGYLVDQPVNLNKNYTSLALIKAGPNPVAAMPSLHMAYPSYIAFILLYYWRKKAIPIILLPCAVGFATLYLGHHYIVDLIAGCILSLFVFCISLLIMKKREKQLLLAT